MHIPPNSPHFFKLGLIGWPVEHSLSPLLHQAALKAANLSGEYQLFAVENDFDRDQRLAKLIDLLKSGEMDGFNVTIPHKQHVMPLLDDLSPAAKQIGAVNTLYLKNGKVIGDNTDGQGFLHDLYHQMDGIQSSGKNALVFGAGGSARAVVFALVQDDWQVTIYARRAVQAAELANHYSRVKTCNNLKDVDWAQMDLAVNCTPLGMTPNTAQSPWPEELTFPSWLNVYDLVYSPRQTRLIWQAKASNIRACNGLGMLVEQAALAFELWTGVIPDRAAMKAAVE